VPLIAPRNYSLGDLQIGLILRPTASKARMLENHAAERSLLPRNPAGVTPSMLGV
jgi:hypothetical protein